MVGYANGRVVEVVDDIHCDEVELVHVDVDGDVLDVVMAGVVVNQEWEEVAVVISLVSSS